MDTSSTFAIPKQSWNIVRVGGISVNVVSDQVVDRHQGISQEFELDSIDFPRKFITKELVLPRAGAAPTPTLLLRKYGLGKYTPLGLFYDRKLKNA